MKLPWESGAADRGDWDWDCPLGGACRKPISCATHALCIEQLHQGDEPLDPLYEDPPDDEPCVDEDE